MVGGAAHAVAAAVQHVAVNLSRPNIAMPEPFLNRSDVVASLQQMFRKAVPKRMTRCGFGYFGSANGRLHGFLDHGL